MSAEFTIAIPTRELVAEFTVAGEPVSKARARFTKRGSKTLAYTPQKTLDAEKDVAAAFRSAGGLMEKDAEVTFAVDATFHNATRQRRDVDNMLKLILDGLNGVAWVDDTQVTDVVGRKRFVVEKGDARTDVAVYRVGVIDRITATCERCGLKYATYRSLLGKTRFCSPECRDETRREARTRYCENCGSEWEASSPGSKARFCSRKCRAEAGSAEVTCAECGTTFTTYASWVNQKRFCSRSCRDAGARKTRQQRKATHFPGSCLICGAGTTRKEYKRCNPCKLAGKKVPE